MSNFHHARGGFQYAPVVAAFKGLDDALRWERLRDVGLFGFILMMCIYHFILYALRRKDLSSLAFACLCLVIAARHFVTSRLYQLASEEPTREAFIVLLRLEYLTMYAALFAFGFSFISSYRARGLSVSFRHLVCSWLCMVWSRLSALLYFLPD